MTPDKTAGLELAIVTLFALRAKAHEEDEASVHVVLDRAIEVLRELAKLPDRGDPRLRLEHAELTLEHYAALGYQMAVHHFELYPIE